MKFLVELYPSPSTHTQTGMKWKKAKEGAHRPL